jgi:tetratricopeptide (TPR) repeat protein
VVLAVLSSGVAWARPELAEPPHFLDLEEVERVVFFAGEAVPGALATTLADGTIEVTVPGVGVGAKLEGRTFHDVATTTGRLSATVEETDTGDIRILLRPTTAGVRARAYAATQPPRLVIDLSAGNAPAAAKRAAPEAARAMPAARPTVSAPSAPAAPLPVATQVVMRGKPGATAESPAGSSQSVTDVASAPKGALASASQKEAKSSATTAPIASAASAPASLALAPPAKGSAAPPQKDDPATARTQPGATPPAGAIGSAAKRPLGAPELGAGTASSRSSPPPAPALAANARPASPPANPGAAPAAVPVVGAHTKTPAKAPASAPAAPPAGAVVAPAAAVGSPEATADEAQGSAASPVTCLWTRVKGLPFCAPDPDAQVYAEPELAQAAADLTRGRIHGLEELFRDGTGARRFLAADRLLVAHAADGWLLRAANAYIEALRAEPDFGDATRARVNLALVYRAMGFTPEVLQLAVRDNPGAPVARALLGEMLLAEGRREEGQEALMKAADAGGLAACLAARGLVELALLENDRERASTGLGALPRLCPPPLATDPETERLQAMLRARSGDADAALARVEWLEKVVHPSERGLFVETIGEVAERAGHPDRARRAYERLVGGEFGGHLQRRGTVGLARLDAEAGQLGVGLRRLGELGPDGNGSARREVMTDVSAEVLKEGGASDAVALLHSEQIDPQALAADQQVLLARRYRELGFPEHGSNLLLQLRRSRPPAELPADFWSELGENALARGDASAGVGAADDWRAQSGESAGELALRMRALARLGAAAALVDQTGASLDQRDPVAAAQVRIDLARAELGRDPGRARALTTPAIAPAVLAKLPESEAAAALWIHAQACERSGDGAAAIASFRLLVQSYPKSPPPGGGGYRLARLAAQSGDTASAALGYAAAEEGGDPLTKRVAVAARTFDEIVGPLAMEKKP